MATALELASLRDYINEPDDTNGWDEEKLADYLTRYSTGYGAAAAIWGVKASQYVELVNVSESGSSRSFGDMFARAKEMATYYRGLDSEAGASLSGGPVIARIRRSVG